MAGRKPTDWDSREVTGGTRLIGEDPGRPDLTLYDFSDQPWRREALCKGADHLFFTERGTPLDKAVTLCMECPVRIDCIGYAIETRPSYGLWGGLGAKPLQHIRRLLKAEPVPMTLEEAIQYVDGSLDDRFRPRKRRGAKTGVTRNPPPTPTLATPPKPRVIKQIKTTMPGVVRVIKLPPPKGKTGDVPGPSYEQVEACG